MPQVRQLLDQSAEHLRDVYRALGMREQTLERAINYRVGSEEPAANVKQRRGRPRQKARLASSVDSGTVAQRRTMRKKRA